MKITQYILSLLLLAGVSQAQETTIDSHITIYSQNLTHNSAKSDGTSYNGGLALTKILGNNIMLSAGLNLEYTDTDESISPNHLFLELEFKAGYQYKEITPYILGAIKVKTDVFTQDNSGDAVGYGFGGGVGYNISKNFNIFVEYKHYQMSQTLFDYDSDMYGVGIGFKI